MKLSASKSALLESVNIAARAASNKSNLPILEGILLEANEHLTLTAYDLTMGIRTSVDAHIIEPGKTVLNARLLSDILRKLPDDTIYLDVDLSHRATIRCGKAQFQLLTGEAEDFPALAEVDDSRAIAVEEQILKRAIAQTIFAVAISEVKPVLTGEQMIVEGDTLLITAVDGNRIARRKIPLAKTAEIEKPFVIPGPALRELERILEETDELCTICPNPKHILIKVGKTQMITRLLEGLFMQVDPFMMPPVDTKPLLIDVPSLTTAVERVSLIASEKLKHPVRIELKEGMITLSCITTIGKSYDECPMEGSAKPFEIGFNHRFLLDMLRALSHEQTVQMYLTNDLSPMLVMPTDGDAFGYLVLPVRLKADGSM